MIFMYSLKLCKNTKKTTFRRKIIRIFAQIKSLTVFSRYLDSMRSYKFEYSYPLLSIGIALSIGIVIGETFHSSQSTCYGLVSSICQLILCLLCKKEKPQSLLILITVLCVGFTLASHQKDEARKQTSYYTYQELSAFDRTKLQAAEWKQDLEDSYRQMNIPQDGYAILTAMTLGDKSALDQETKAYYSASGASHITAVSGLHIGIIFQLLLFILAGKRSYNRHYIPNYLIILALTSIWAYTLLIGMPASAIRSSCMVSIYCMTLVMRRRSKAINCLMLTAIIMLCFSPSYIFDISFQLSFIAVLFIITLFPKMAHWIDTPWTKKHPLMKSPLTMLSVSVAAQIGTMPIIAYYFGHISCYSLLANMIAIPSATLILYGGVGYLICAPFPCLQTIFAHILSFVTKILNESISIIAHLPGASIKGIKISILQLCLLYVAIIAGCILIHKLRLFHFHRNHLCCSHKDYNSQGCQTSPLD